MENEFRDQAENGEESHTASSDDNMRDASSESTDDEATSSTQSQTDADDLTDELYRELTVLGGRFVHVIQTAWNSDERKRIEADLKGGIVTVAESLEDGFAKVRDNEQTKETLDKADEMAESVGDKVRSNEAVQELGSSLVRGLHALANQLEKWTEEMVEKAESSTANEQPKSAQDADDEIQDIQIEQE